MDSCWQAAAHGVARSYASLFSNPQGAQLEGAPIDFFRRSGSASHNSHNARNELQFGFHLCVARFWKTASPASETSTHLGCGVTSAL